MRSSRPFWGVSFLLSLLLAGVFLVFYIFPKDQPAPTQEKLRLGLAMQPSSALAIVALEKDFFLEVGLDIELHEFPSGKRALNEGLFSGEVDMATTSDLPATMAVLAEKDVRILASAFLANNVNRIVARKSAGIMTPEDLKGKRLATQKSSAVHYFLHAFQVRHRIGNDEIDLSFLKAEELPRALAEKRIDAFSMREPYVSEAINLLGDDAIVFSAPGSYDQVDVVICTKSLLEMKPHIVRRFVEALLLAERFAEKNQQAAIDIVANHIGAPKEKIAAIWPEIRLSMAFGHNTLLLMESQARWAIANKLTDASEVPNFLEFLALDAMTELKPEAVTIIR